MRIVSKFRDYYDCMQRSGVDLNVVYVRTRKDIPACYPRVAKASGIPKGEFIPPIPGVGTGSPGWDLRREWMVRKIRIGFCGKIYPIYQMKNARSGAISTFYEYPSLEEFTLPLLDKKSARRFKSAVWGTAARLRQFFEEPVGMAGWFLEYRTPIFVAWSEWRDDSFQTQTLSINAPLAEWGFYRVFDPPRAYQEIYMYLASVLAQPEKPMPEQSDKVMRDIKGFDKWSFRKEPSKKR